MPKSQACACGVKLKAHSRKSRRKQLPRPKFGGKATRAKSKELYGR